MNHAVNLNGDKLIVLSLREYEEILEDASDLALAHDAMEGPTMSIELADAIADGQMHPLTAWRKSIGLSQSELAKKSGCRTATISDWENRKISPRLDTAKAIANAIGVSIENLVE